MHTFVESRDNRLFHVQVSGTVTKEDVQDIAERADEMIDEYGKINIICELKEFKGYTVSAFFEDFHYGMTHRDSFERIAIVGDNKIEEMFVNLSNLFMKGEIKYFSHNNLNEAMDWMKEKVHS